MSDETPSADSPAHASTPISLPTTAPSAARRPSLAATRRTRAVAGPGVNVTTAATTRNSHTERMPGRYGRPLTPVEPVFGSRHGRDLRPYVVRLGLGSMMRC